MSKTVAADDLPIRALDDTTFQVELKAPASYFITLTASTAFMPVCKANVEKYGEDWSSSPETYVCNGPFMLADMKKDESFTFVKNPNYYNADEVKIDTVKYVFLNAPETVRMAFDNGELDIATSVNSDAMKAYTGTDKLVTSDRIGYRYYEFNCSKAPFNDARVRRALTLALNRKIITAKHLQKQESGAVLLTDDGRRAFLGAWQSKKQEQITHPFLKEKIPWGLVPYVQALLLARTLRGDLEAYPPFFWK